MPEQPCTWLSDHPEALGEEVRPAHLETCEQCRQQVEGLERLLRRALTPEPVPVPPELAARIDAAVVARYGGGKRRGSSAWALAALVLVVLLLAAAGGVAIVRRPGTEDRDGPLAHEPADAGALPRARELPTVAPGSSTKP